MKDGAPNHRAKIEHSRCAEPALPDGANLQLADDLPKMLPVLPGEIDLLGIYFADLIDAFLQGTS